MSLATAVIKSAADKNTASLFSEETKIIKALLKQYEARAYLIVDVLNRFSQDRLHPLLKGNNRRKEVWIYHHIGAWDSEVWQQIKADLPALKLLYVSGSMRQEDLAACFAAGVQAVLTTGSEGYGSNHLLFARKFYANLSAGAKLEDAFEQARIFVEMEQRQLIQKTMPFFQWLADQPAGQHTVPWGLFYRGDAASILSFSLPQKSKIHIVSKKEQRSWLTRQHFKDVFLKEWGMTSQQFHLLTIEDGPAGMGQVCQVIREEICLPYQQAGVRVLKIDFSASLEEAKIKLLAQLKEALGKSLAQKEDPSSAPVYSADGLVFLVKIFQSEWPSYGAELLEWMKQSAITVPPAGMDLIFICTLIADQIEPGKKAQPATSIKRIVDACKSFLPSGSIDFRL